MRGTAKEKSTRTNRRARSVKPEPDHTHHLLHHHLHHHHHITTNCTISATERAALSKSLMESGLGPMNCHSGLNDSAQIANPNLRNSVCDDNGWGYCSEEQLEDILLKNLELLYNEAISKLIGLGYDADVALKAILRNGHCYGGMDVLSNILQNALGILNSGTSSGSEQSEPAFSDLRQLEEYSLAGMICLLQQVKPHLSKGDAMWCLLMNDLHVGRASVMDFSVHPAPSGMVCGSECCSGGSGTVCSNVEGNSSAVGVAPSSCRSLGDWGVANGCTSELNMNGFFACASEMALQKKEIDFPKRFTLSPSMKSLLKKNVASFAASYKNPKQMQNPSQGSLSGQDSSGVNGTGVEGHAAQSEDPQNPKNQESVNSALLSKFRDMNLEESAVNGSLDQKDEMILSVLHQIKDLERQVTERKEWAHQKAMQAARKLAHDLTELKTLRMEREETQRLKKGKQTLEDSTMKKLQEMENNLRKASAQVDRANAAVRKLETENAEIRAEMEASKLSASESVSACLEVAKREKKYLKRLSAWEKHQAKLQEDIAGEKQNIEDLQQQLIQVDAASKEIEVKSRQAQKAKEQALAEVEEDRRHKESAEGNNKRKLESLRLKIEIDFQRHKDDLQRLEEELSRLQASAQEEHDENNSADNSPQGNNTVASLLNEFENLNVTSYDRLCVLCSKDEVSVVFLPCAHQVLCATCNENYGKKGKATCPCCRIPIEQRIRIFGASS